MAETKHEVTSYEVDYICDECLMGRMRPTGMCLASTPPQYPHICSSCGHAKTFTDVCYPYIVHR